MESRSETPSADELLAHAAFVRWLAFDLVGDHAEAEDVAQETMLVALRKPPAILTSMKSWLAGVTRNVVRMRRRAEGRKVTREKQTAKPEATASAADSAATMETFRLLTQAVDDLGEPNRTMVLLRYYEGLMPGEIASRLSIPVKTVKSRLHRSLTLLRARLDDQHGERTVWTALLLPLAKAPSPIGTAPVVSGAIVMSMKTKIAAAIAAVLLLAAAGIYISSHDASPPPQPPETPALAGLPDDPGDPEGTTEGTVDLTPPLTTPAVPPGQARVRVRVVDAETGAPVPHVVVFHHDVTDDFIASPDDDESMILDEVIEDELYTTRARAGEDGRATLLSKPGPRLLVVRHPRYRDYLGERFPLAAGADREATIRLVPYPAGEREIRFGGTVTDGETKLALAGVTVLCRYVEGAELVTLEAVSDLNGKFSFKIPKNAPIGLKYTLSGYEEHTSALNPIHQDWLNGDTALLRLGSGPKRGEARITGLITDAATGSPIAGVSLVLLRNIGQWGGFQSGKDGQYRIDTPAVDDAEEKLRIGIVHPGYERFRSEEITIAPDRTVTHHIALVPETGESGLAGQVIDDRTGEPIRGARVHTEDVFSDPLDVATTTADGTFKLTFRGGESAILVTAEGYSPFSQDIGQEVSTRAASLRSLTLRLIRADARITGIVTDAATDQPLAGVALSLFTEPEWSGPGPVAVTDEQGRYSFPVAAGRYAIRAIKDGYGPGCSNATRVATEGTAQADIPLHRLDCVLTGRVSNSATGDDLPIQNGDIFVSRLPRDDEDESLCNLASFGSLIDTPTEGAVYTARLIPGRYLVVLNRHGYQRFEAEVEVRQGEERSFDLELTPGE